MNTTPLDKPSLKAHLAQLLKLTKLKTFSSAEADLDQAYLEDMISSLAKIHAIQTNHLLPTTHAFHVTQRLREDQVICEKKHSEACQKQAPARIMGGLYSVPAVIE